MLGAKARKAVDGNRQREGEFSERDTRIVFAVLAVGVLIGALLMPGKSPASAKAKAPTPAGALASKSKE